MWFLLYWVLVVPAGKEPAYQQELLQAFKTKDACERAEHDLRAITRQTTKVLGCVQEDELMRREARP